MRRDRRMMRDGRNPYGSRGGYISSSRPRGDRASSGRGRSMGRGRDGYTGDLADPLYNERKRIVEESMGQYPIHSDYEYATDYDKASGRGGNRGGNRSGGRGRDNDMGYGRNINYMGRYGNTPFEMRSMEDYQDYEDYGEYDYEMDYAGYDMNYDMDYEMDYARGGRGGRGRGRDRRDYGEDEGLEKEELSRWTMKLKSKLEPKDKEMFSKEKVINKAKQMGIDFEEFSEEELYLTTLMMYTDYNRTLGAANLDIYMKLAKDWLMDDDVEARGSEKLAKYYEEIVMGD